MGEEKKWEESRPERKDSNNNKRTPAFLVLYIGQKRKTAPQRQMFRKAGGPS